ncbi:hypothetical protein AVEN_32065-1 [Araneus ventricosus]|uniref:Uncharacterized protein n=1 Tax=Araneus ventricosus TaxID=182803 RepID=A0A4Y2EEV4_ARAVE|nr:hypothetical protein AVEN_32065-1 [Araneus ventricosus]
MTNLSALIYELVVLPECRLAVLQLTGTPVKNEYIIKKEVDAGGNLDTEDLDNEECIIWSEQAKTELGF